VGYDSVHIASATARGIPVTITPTANHEAVAELALALLFAVTKSIVTHDRAIRDGKWPRRPLLPLRRRKLGIVGLGRIGRSLAVRAAALGMQVLAADTMPNREFLVTHGIQLLDLDSLLRESDFVSLHCPLDDQTRGFFNAAVFAKMKPGSILINTSRGGLINERDLLEALTSGHLGGAGLDVLAQEPPPADHPLFRLNNVVLSPHIGGVDELSLEAMGVEAASCIAQLYRGQWPTGAVVNDQLKAGWRWPAG
jgi:phosphoglycerate dehydrogenase-like enzyme